MLKCPPCGCWCSWAPSALAPPPPPGGLWLVFFGRIVITHHDQPLSLTSSYTIPPQLTILEGFSGCGWWWGLTSWCDVVVVTGRLLQQPMLAAPQTAAERTNFDISYPANTPTPPSPLVLSGCTSHYLDPKQDQQETNLCLLGLRWKKCQGFIVNQFWISAV